MSKINSLNIILLIFIIGLISLIIFKPGKKEAITPPTLTNLKVEDIHHILIKRHNDKDKLELTKKDGHWLMLSPYQLSANSFRIESLLKLLSAASLSQNNITDLKLDNFGLSKPLATITFNKSTRMEFGHNKSLRNHRYIRIDNVLHMIADTFYYQVATHAKSFINHALLPEKSNIVQLTAPSFKLKQTQGKWELSPKSDKFSADTINQLISEWQLSQAYDVKVKKSSMLEKPDVEVELKNKKIIRFKIETSKSNFSLTNIDTGISYVLSTDRKDKLLKLIPTEKNDLQ